MLTPEEDLALKALEAVEWSVYKDDYFGLWCPGCNECKDDGHHLDCLLKRAMDALRSKKAAGSSTVAVESEPTPEEIVAKHGHVGGFRLGGLP